MVLKKVNNILRNMFSIDGVIDFSLALLAWISVVGGENALLGEIVLLLLARKYVKK